MRIAHQSLLVQYFRTMRLDPKDIQLLSILQKNGQTSALELSEVLDMSASQIGRRRQRLEADGLIVGTPCRLDPVKLGLTVQAFIQVQTDSQDGETHRSIKRLVDIQPEIIAAWTLTGEADYIFRVYCENLSALNRLVQDVLLPHPAIGRVHSQIVMDQVKDDTALPLPL
ncbi:Lrp/AsnC family transcriptional regulator [Marivita sp. S6314]|uniref:Lrp/AsnC family transcriptional regulator n=1 Tax=Marivita sp. S6314 TaxID=2926406 RepID=UPI001FF5281B|nr:Lrp/AsnC family transcriptional regulator [Marivita sp. S6314]